MRERDGAVGGVVVSPAFRQGIWEGLVMALLVGVSAGAGYIAHHSHRLDALEAQLAETETERTEFRCGWCKFREEEKREGAGSKVR